jgi:hypothetical protein
MTRRLGYFWRLVLFPLAILIFLICAGPALAGSIYVFDGFAFGGLGFGIRDLIGERGFTLDSFGQSGSGNVTSALGSCGQIIRFDHRCQPGQSLPLSETSFSFSDAPGHATLDGQKYLVGGFGGPNPGGFPGFTIAPPGCLFPSAACDPVTAAVQVTVTAPNVIAPPFSAAVCPPLSRCSATLTAPFKLTGLFAHLDSSTGQVFTDELFGSGIASLTLQLESSPNGTLVWNHSGQSYDLQATPEPATLFLVGAGVTGLGLARWVKRRRSRGEYDAA